MNRDSHQLPKRVVIVQRILPHYRVPFFDSLDRALGRFGTELRVIFGRERLGTVPISVEGEWPWAIPIRNRYLTVGRFEIVWQPCIGLIKDQDFVIVEQATRLLINYWLTLRRRIWAQRVAYWGHGGRVFSPGKAAAPKGIRRMLAMRADWWFAYTSLSAEAIRLAGFPESRISVVDNAIDIGALRAAVALTTERDLQCLRNSTGITGRNVAAFCGGMYPDKKLDFLIDSCEQIRRRIPDFEMLFIGSGPEQHKIEAACSRNEWMRLIGPTFGKDLARYLMLSKILLMPGAVGLVILDSFAASCPLITTTDGRHGPEIAYLVDGQNGLITSPSNGAYVETVCAVLSNDQLLDALRSGCRESGTMYSIDRMVQQFVSGISACMTSERWC